MDDPGSLQPFIYLSQHAKHISTVVYAELKAAVDRLLDQEMRRMRRRDDRCPLPTQVELFQDNATLKEEWDRVKQKQPLNVLDTERYELKGPANDDDIEGWQKAVDNTKSQLESQAGR